VLWNQWLDAKVYLKPPGLLVKNHDFLNHFNALRLWMGTPRRPRDFRPRTKRATSALSALGVGSVCAWPVASTPDNTAVVYCDGTDVLAISVGGEESADLPYDPAMFIPGTHGSGALLPQIVFPRTVTFPAGFAGSEGYAQVPATAITTLDVQQNGVSIGSITFGAASSTATFSLSGDSVFAPGDRLATINEDPADATLADLSITFLGKRT
jgi:hypothetical protein